MSIYEAWSDVLDPRMGRQVSDIVPKIVALERRARALEALCQDMLEEIRVNYDRGHLTSPYATQFEWMLQRWYERLGKLKEGK